MFPLLIYLFTAILLAGGSGYFTCKQNMKLVTTRFKSAGLHEKHVVSSVRLLEVWLLLPVSHFDLEVHSSMRLGEVRSGSDVYWTVHHCDN